MDQPSTTTELDRLLLAAHAECNHGDLVRLYTCAADDKEAQGNIEATCFFLTQAFIFALESGDENVASLNRRLVAYGREEPL